MILLVSILVRFAAMSWSIVLLKRVRDRRMLFLTAMLGLMMLRQLLTMISALRADGVSRLTSVGDVNELPGLAVSILAAAAVIFLARIILDRRELARTLDETMVRSQKMEAVGQFAGGVAHDFNNMLTAISANAMLAKLKLEADSEAHSNLAAIEDAADRSAHLTRQLLTFARRDDVEVEVLDANALIEDLAPSIHNLVGERIELVTSLVSEPALLSADRRQMEHVLINLVVNARDAMEGGGRLTLAVELENAADRIVIKASDTGDGIDRSVLDRIFEPFFTTKPVGEGTGLGLASCHAVVSRAGGTISVDSEVGEGTVFTLSFPRETSKALEVSAEPSAAEETGGEERILLVEDEPLVRLGIAALLRRAGFDVIEADDGIEALRMAQESEEPIDLVLSDMVMPKMSGAELAEKLVEARPSIKILLMSGYRGEPVAETDGGLTFPLLAKPFTSDQLAERVRAVLGQG